MQHNLIAIYDNVLLRPLEVGDIEKLRNWRNDKENSKFLRDIGTITPEMQMGWFNNYLVDPDEYIFAIEELSELKRVVGSVSVYNFNGDSAEVGKILIGDKEANGRGLGRKSLVMAMKIGFDKLGVKRYVGSVHQDNVQAHTNDMKVGFIITGKHPYPTGGYEDEILLTPERLAEVNAYTEEIVIRGSVAKYYVGQKFTFSKTLIEADVYNYAGISGDFNPVHINQEKAQSSLFGKTVCHGMLTASLISTCIGTKMDQEGIIYLEQNTKFLKPVYPGDTCTVVVTIKEIDENKRVLLLNTDVFNQEDAKVISGNAKVKCPSI